MLLRSRLILVFLCLSGAVCSSVYAVNPTATDRTVTVESDICAVRLEYDFARMSKSSTVVDGVERTLHVVPDEGTTYDHGKPVLPAISRWVVVPPTAGVELVVTADPPRRVPADSKPLLNSEGDSTAVSTLTGSDGIYPNVIAAMGEPIILRGVRMVLVTTYPVRYDANTNSYLYYDRIRTELRFTDEEPVNPAELSVRRNRSPHFLNTLENLAINPENIGRDDPDHPQEYVGHYLIVIHDSLLQYVSPFVEWRRKSGWKVDIYSVADKASVASIKTGIQARYDAYKNAGVDPFDHIFLVGDRTSNDGCGAPVGWILNADAGKSTWGGPAHADYKYALLEGNDDYPDVAIARWNAGSKALMDLNTGKTLGFEATPRMENPEWFTTGGVMSTHYGNSEFCSWHITSHTNMRWASEVMEKVGFTNIVSYEDYTWDQSAKRLGPVYKDLLNNGSSLLFTDGEIYYWRQNANGINPNTVHPIDVSISCKGEWAGFWLTRSGDGANLIGPVAKTFGWMVDTFYEGPAMLTWLSVVRGILMNDMTLGWARTFSTANLATFYGNNLDILYTRTDFDVAGDPGIQPWLGVPQVVTATFPDVVTPKTKTVELEVTDEQAGTPVSGAQVTVYAPGNMPAFDSPDYARYSDMKMWTTTSDSDGLARLVFPDGNEFAANTEIFFTVTGRKICPFFGKTNIKDQTAIEVGGYTLEEVGGNEDGKINPGETFHLSLKAANVGVEGAINGVRGRVISLSGYVEVEENDVVFGDINANEAADGNAPVVLRISPACPDGASSPKTKPTLLIEFTDGNAKWTSAIQLTCLSPNLEVISVVGGNIIPQDGEEHELEIELTNVGSFTTAESFTASLRPLVCGASLNNRQSHYDRIDAGASAKVAGDKFLIKGTNDVAPGSLIGMVLVLRTEDGFQDSAFFQLQIGETGENRPSLPDKYGYSVFDDTDNGWKLAPVYDWWEISDKDDEREFDGISCGFDGKPDDPYGYNTGQTIVVPLGFTTGYYGYEYDTISICSNGFISMGSQPKIINYQNWQMDQAIGGGVGMIAPFWDKLKLDPEIGNVYYFYDEDNARFIIEWYKIKQYTDPQGDLIFQVMLYDKDVWSPETGDTPILIQYKSISNAPNIGGGGTGISTDTRWVSDNPYASVGISSPDGNTGVNYCFADVYPTSSAPLQNGRALKFVVTPKFPRGVIYGTVTDLATGAGVSNVTVSTNFGTFAQTDQDGLYRIEDGFAEVGFDVSATKQGYNLGLITDTVITLPDSLRLDFALLHPEIFVSQERFQALIEKEGEQSFDFSLTNRGNGPLEWNISRRLPNNAHLAPWQRRESIPIGQITNRSRIQGVVLAEDRYVVSVGKHLAGVPNMIYIVDREFAVVDSFPQFGDSRLGMYDLAYDGELVWGGDDRTLYGFTVQGELKKHFDVPVDFIRGLAWDSKDDWLLVGGRSPTSPYIAVDRDGQVMHDYGHVGFLKAGIACWSEDPDGYTTYYLHDRNGVMTVHKENLETRDTLFVTELKPAEGGTPEGIFITDKYDVYSWVFMSIVNGVIPEQAYEDRIDILQLQAKLDWFNVFTADNPNVPTKSGIVPAGESRDFVLYLNSTDLEPEQYIGELVISHNAIGGEQILDVELRVIGDEPPEPFGLVHPDDRAVMNANDSTQVTFQWEPSSDLNANDTIKYLFYLSTQDSTAEIAILDSTIFLIDFAEFTWEQFLLPPPVDSLTEFKWWVVARSGEDAVSCNEPRTFTYVRKWEGVSDQPIPVVFGLNAIYPSPFNSVTTIRYGADRAEHMSIRVFDVNGRLVTTLTDAPVKIGTHLLVWNASGVSSGVYVIRLESGGRVRTAKTVLVK